MKWQQQGSNARSFTQKDVDIISKSTKYDGYFKMDHYQLRFHCFAGHWSPTLNRELFERGMAAAILPYDPKRKKVILVEQFRIGALQDETSPWLIELIAGVVESNELPSDVVQREAMEEANIRLEHVKPICEYWSSPGGSSEKIYLFYTEVDAAQVEGVHGLQEEGEDIRVWGVDVDEAFAAVASGDINNAPAIIALQWLQLRLTGLR